MLFGLEQSPCSLFEKYNSVLLQVGDNRYSSDHIFFVKHREQDVILCTDVDDILLTRDDNQGTVELK